MKRLQIAQRLTTIVVFLVILGVAGVVVMVSGIVPISARSGHWAITEWVLHFSKSRSIATHSLGIKPPNLDDPLLIVKGAGHYQTGCAECHGSPIRPASPIALNMTAKPPHLAPVVAQRKSRELFYIVNNGIKFTGMPAWPAEHRGDEVWAIVAFLLQFPSMDAQQYRELVYADARSSAQPAPSGVSSSIFETCRRCHGADGLGRGLGAFPKLAGQNREYLFASLKAFADGDRHSGIMQPVAAVLSENELSALADHFSQLPAGPAPTQRNDPSRENPITTNDTIRTADVLRGKEIAEQGLPKHSVPSCVECHGPAADRQVGAYPELAGQYAPYLGLQLKLFQDGRRGGTEVAHLMDPVVARLRAQDMRDVAAYYASLSPLSETQPGH